jgi:hypothetical protein
MEERVTHVDLPARGGNMEFFAHRAVQEVIQRRWLGGLDASTSVVSVGLALASAGLLGGLIPTKLKLKATAPAATTAPTAKAKGAGAGDSASIGACTGAGAGGSIAALSPSYWQKLMVFLSAPIVAFVGNLFCYIGLLALFTHVCMVPFHDGHGPGTSTGSGGSGSGSNAGGNHHHAFPVAGTSTATAAGGGGGNVSVVLNANEVTLAAWMLVVMLDEVFALVRAVTAHGAGAGWRLHFSDLFNYFDSAILVHLKSVS